MIYDTTLYLNGEMIENRGEDGYYCIEDEDREGGVIAVFDGCGGLGGRKYMEYSGHTGAYMASSVLSVTMTEWNRIFHEDRRIIGENNNAHIVKSLEEKFNESLQHLGGGTSALKGSMTKAFPTTASIIIYRVSKNFVKALFIWAGDSRGYVLNEAGLAQVTVDDIDGNDAMQNIMNDGKLNNVISAEGKYILNKRYVNIGQPSILITATDGCFSYYRTPMEFEFMLLDTLILSQTPNEWKERMNVEIRNHASDDYTLCASLFGYVGFDNVKSKLAARRKYMYNEYIRKLESQDAETPDKLWEKYKDSYYRGPKCRK